MPLWNFGQPVDGVVQIASTCADIQVTMQQLTRELGIGPWFLIEHFPFKSLTVRGKPDSLDLTLALGQSGHTQFELIQQNDMRPSVYREVAARRGHGFHHWAIGAQPARYQAIVDQYLQRGYALAMDAVVGVGGRAAYVDTFNDLGGYIEIIEMLPVVEGLFNTVYQASVGWNGQDPVRRLG
ncbi:MAG: VOC family protein [Steroidobacteraceae bacterium]